MATIIREIKPEMVIPVFENGPRKINSTIKGVKKDDLILLTGSLYMLGEAREYRVPKDKILYEVEIT